MRSIRNWTTAWAVVLCAGLMAGSAAAEPPDVDEQRAGRFITEHAAELELDDATRVQIESVVERTRSEARRLRRAQGQAARTLHDLLELDAPDDSAVMSQADVVGELDSARRKLRIAAMLEIRALLTPEQRSKLVELRSAQKSERPSRRERRERMRACGPDVERLCPDADHPRAVMHCLEEGHDSLSEACSEAFDSLRAEREAGRARRRGGFDDRP